MTKLMILRVELHGATATSYQNLHTAMQVSGFKLTITANDGRVYKLPTAMYSFNGNSTREQILDHAATAAAVTGLRAAIIVIESGGSNWIGLDLDDNAGHSAAHL